MNLPSVNKRLQMSTILRDFTLMYLFGLVVVAVMVGLVMYFFPDMSDSSGAMGVLVPMIAAMQVGQLHYKRTGTALGGGFAWKAALACAVISIVISLAIAWLVVSLNVDPELSAMIAELREPGNLPIMAAIMAGCALLLVAVIRGGFALGSRSQMKAEKRQARNG